MKPALDVGVPRKQIPRPGECVCGRLVPGQKQRHRFVAELGVCHAAAIALGVLGEEEHRQQVTSVFATRATLLDDPVDRGVESGTCRVEPLHVWERQSLQDLTEWQYAYVERFEC